MWIKKTFNKYEVIIFGGSDKVAAILYCYDGSSYSGRIRFFADDSDLPSDCLVDSSKGEIATPNQEEWISLSMPMSRFESIMSTVRLEKPLYLLIQFDKKNTTDWYSEGFGYLATTEKEPVGEEEGASK